MSRKVNLTKLSNTQVSALKGKLLEVRRIGAKPIFVKITTKSSINDALKNADIPTNNSIKVEGMIEGSNTWEAVTLKARAIKYSKIAVTTKVSGA